MSESSAPTPEPAPAPAPIPAASPSKPATQPPPRGRIDRTVIGVNVLIQLIAVFIIVVVANIIAYRHYHRWDLSHNNNYALSSKTKNLLAHLDQPVRATVFFPQAQALSKDVANLLREYEFSSNRKFSVEYVDPYKNLTRARELQDKFKFGQSDNIVILEYKGKSKYVNASDMAELDNSGAMFGQPPVMKAFKGEEAITSALQEITEEKQNKLYLLTGHGEPDLKEGGGAGAFRTYLQRENIKFEALNLNDVDAVPADATGLMVFGPKTDLSEREIFMLNDYWDQRKGRLIILLNPAGKSPRLGEWLTNQGVMPQNDRVLKTGTVLVMGDNGQPTMKTGLITSPSANLTQEGHEITKDISGGTTQLFGATQSLLLDRSRTQTQKVKFISLLESGEGFWGETEYVQGENRNTFFDPKKDHIGPLIIGVALEKGALDDARVKVDTARMLVVGNSGFLTDDGLRVSEVGLDFALLSINWMFNRELVAGIPPKPKKAVSLDLKDEQIAQIFYSTVVAIPLATAIFGLFVAWHRRNRNLLELAVWVIGTAMFITGFVWCINLWLLSREAGTATVNLRSFAIPATLIVLSLLALVMKISRSNETPAQPV